MSIKAKEELCKVYFWVRTKYDSRWCAGSTGYVLCLQKHAYKLANKIHRQGQKAIDEAIEKEIVSDFQLKDYEVGAAAGHGASVHYPSGQIRYIKRD